MTRFLTAVAAVVALGGLGAAVAQPAAPPEPPGANLLPEAPGRTQTVQVCSKCHALEIVTQKHLDPDGWYDLVQMMRDRGARGSDEDMSAIAGYLAKAFPADAAPARPGAG
jgi:cytochrome c553